MERFLERHKDDIIGTLSGFDRVLFRGTLRSISYLNGMEIFLSSQKVLSKDFAPFAEKLSAQLKEHAEKYAAQAHRPYLYVASAHESKEELVRQLLARDPTRDGLICVLSCVEPCQTWTVRKEAVSKHLVLRKELRKCLYLYWYFVDPKFGLLHVRLQTWLPFTIQICLNGRDYLAREMDRAGIGYEREDNCFTRIDDLQRAQQLMDQLETYPWGKFLNSLAHRVNPLLAKKAGLKLRGYYWSIRQGEYATDVIFHDSARLSAIYPALTRHAIENFSSEDVLRFLGRRTRGRFAGRVESSLKRRIEGVRIKHFVEENSIKMYDKAGCVLRIETTINNPRRFKVRRRAARKGQRVKAWLPLRKGIADVHRRVALSRGANARYLEALAVVGERKPSHRLLDAVSQRVERAGHSFRALRPVSPEESQVFRVMMQGEFLLQGFRNQDLRTRLRAEAETDPSQRKRAAGRITRWLRLMCAHG